jgi:amino acid transporter
MLLTAWPYSRFVVGEPLATSEEQHQRPVDRRRWRSSPPAISSTAYATRNPRAVRSPASPLTDLLPISAIVIVLDDRSDYRQTIFAYRAAAVRTSLPEPRRDPPRRRCVVARRLHPHGCRVDLGRSAITSAFPELRPERVLLCLGFVALMMFANLRGLKESGRLFAGPTYLYMIMIIALVGIGFIRYYTGSIEALPPNTDELNELTDNGLLLTGITAMAFLRSRRVRSLTGIEAISNGCPRSA